MLCCLVCAVAASPVLAEGKDKSTAISSLSADRLSQSSSQELNLTKPLSPEVIDFLAKRNGTAIAAAASGTTTSQFLFAGDAVEVDRPTAILYAADGQYVLIAAQGSQPGGANLSVYDAITLAFVRAIPLSNVPAEMALIPGTTSVLITSPGTVAAVNDKVMRVDYDAGMETQLITVPGGPNGVAVSPDGNTALISCANLTWNFVDLSDGSIFATLPGSPGGGQQFSSDWGSYAFLVGPPFFLSSGTQAANLTGVSSTVVLEIIDVATQTVAESYDVFTGFFPQVIMRSSPDGNVIAISIREFPMTIRLFVLDTVNDVVHSVVAGTTTFGASPPLVRNDGTKVAVNTASGLRILDVATGAMINADTSSFTNSTSWWLVGNLSGGQHFMLWQHADGVDGYQVFDWVTGAHVAELEPSGLASPNDVFTEAAVVSPTNDTHVAFFDPHNNKEDLVLLDMNAANPQVQVHSECGDGFEGDRAVDLKLSADHSVAMQLNLTSNNACFIDVDTLSVIECIDILPLVSDGILTADGDMAIVAGRLSSSLPAYDRSSGTTSAIALPAGSFTSYLSLDAGGQYVYTLLTYPDTQTLELARLDLNSLTIDPVRLPLPWSGVFAPLLNGVTSNIINIGVFLNTPQQWGLQSHDGSLLAVATTSFSELENTITLVDLASWTIVDQVPVGDIPASMEFSPDDSLLVMAGFFSLHTIAVDGANSTVLNQIPLATPPLCMTLSPDASKIYIGAQPSFGDDPAQYLLMFDSATLQQTGYLTLPILNDFGFGAAVPEFHSPAHFRWSPDGSSLFVFCWNDDVHRINPVNDHIVQSVTTGLLAPNDVYLLSAGERGNHEATFMLVSSNDLTDGAAIVTLPDVACPADLAVDDSVDINDLMILFSNWNTNGPGAQLAPAEDVVDVFDLFVILASWGECF